MFNGNKNKKLITALNASWNGEDGNPNDFYKGDFWKDL
jgi:hypothetical protein